MRDFLDILAQDSKQTVEDGYYQIGVSRTIEAKRYSFRKTILRCERNPIITEVKLASPFRNTIREKIEIVDVAFAMLRGGAVGISVLTEPKHFKGSLKNFFRIRESINAPVLMKDFVVSQIQIDAASRFGADAVLLIQALFDRNYCDSSLNEMIEYAHAHRLEVLLEAHNEDEFRKAITTDADLIGINNRDLRTLAVDLNVTQEILKKNVNCNRIIVSESGIESPEDLRLLRNAGAHAFLVGTAVMSANNIEKKVRELTEA
jgi:indole-3-glycerol phosphate synthase